jgi:hypothetical protein
MQDPLVLLGALTVAANAVLVLPWATRWLLRADHASGDRGGAGRPTPPRPNHPTG